MDKPDQGRALSRLDRAQKLRFRQRHTRQWLYHRRSHPRSTPTPRSVAMYNARMPTCSLCNHLIHHCCACLPLARACSARNLSPCLLPLCRCPGMASIPTISLVQAGTRQLSDALLDACTGPGFFYLTDSPIRDELIDAAWSASEAFFLDDSQAGMAAKEASRDRIGHTGYTALLEEKLDGGAAHAGDLKESFYLARLAPLAKAQSLPPMLDQERAALSELFEACRAVCGVVMEAFATALGLDERFFARCHHAADDRLRLIHYPPVAVPSSGSSSDAATTKIRAGSHSDYGTITLLFQRGVSGLQVQRPEDETWMDIAPKAGAIVVNVGDALEFWTAAVFRSTQHRVVMPRTSDEAVSRFSMCVPNGPPLGGDVCSLAFRPPLPHPQGVLLPARRRCAARAAD